MVFSVDTKTVLGKGGFGKVYKGECNGCKVAVKKQNSNNVYDEIEILKMLKHPNVVELIETKKERGYTFMAMELSSGSLHDAIKTNKNGLPEYELVKLMMDIVLGFGYLVDQQVYHGDIKPHNILIDSKGNYKMADFGLSKIVQNGQELFEIGGSREYCHPILFELLCWKRLHPGTKRPDGQTWPATVDIWSLAVTLFESANGSKPFVAKSPEKLYQIISGKSRKEICGYEGKNGELVRSTSFPNRETSRFSGKLAELLAFMLKPDVRRLPSFQAFFVRVNEFLSFWRRVFN